MRLIDGFDAALIGIATVWQKASQGANRVDTLVYDGDAIVSILVHAHGMYTSEAMEYISFNIEGAYVGEDTPIIVWPCDMEKIKEFVATHQEEVGE